MNVCNTATRVRATSPSTTHYACDSFLITKRSTEFSWTITLITWLLVRGYSGFCYKQLATVLRLGSQEGWRLLILSVRLLHTRKRILSRSPSNCMTVGISFFTKRESTAMNPRALSCTKGIKVIQSVWMRTSQDINDIFGSLKGRF